MRHDGEDGEQSTEHLYSLAVEWLKEGVPPSEVEARLVERGLSPEMASVVMRDASAHPEGDAGGRHATRGFGVLHIDLWRVVRRSPFLFIVFPVLAWFPFNLFAEYAAKALGGDALSEPRIYDWLSSLNYVVVGAWVAAVVLNGVRRVADAAPVSEGPVILQGTREYGHFIKTAWSYGWRCALGTLLFIIPGIVLSIWYALALPVTAFEGRAGGDAVRKSRRITRGRSWQLWWYWIGFFLVYLPWCLAAAWLLPQGETPILNAVSTAPFDILFAFWLIWVALMYVDAVRPLKMVPPVYPTEEDTTEEFAKQQARRGRKRVAAISVFGIVLAVLVFMRMPEEPVFEGSRITFGENQEHEIYYDDDVEQSEAWMMGDVLMNLGWFEEEGPVAVRLGRDPSKYWLYLPIEEELLSDEEMMETFRWMEGFLSEVMEKPTRVVLLIPGLYDWEEVPVHPGGGLPEGWDEPLDTVRAPASWAGAEASAIVEPVLDSAVANREVARWVAEWNDVCGSFYPWSFDFVNVSEHELDPEKGRTIKWLADREAWKVLHSTLERSPSNEFALNMFVHNLYRSGSAWSPYRAEPDRWVYLFREVDGRGWPVMIVGPSTLLHAIGWSDPTTSVILGIGPSDSLDCLYVWRIRVEGLTARVETHRGPPVTDDQREQLERRWPAWVRDHYSEVEWAAE